MARHTFLNRCKAIGIGALLGVVLQACAWAAPAAEEAGQRDPLLEFLQSSGLAARQFLPDTQPLVQGVRDRASELVLSAMNFLGVPYRRGGNSAAQGFDCSGFTRFVFEHSLGLVLPRRSDEQARAPGTATVAKAELKPGIWCFSIPCGERSRTWASTLATASSFTRRVQARRSASMTCERLTGTSASRGHGASTG